MLKSKSPGAAVRRLSLWDCDRGRAELEDCPMTRDERMLNEFIFPRDSRETEALGIYRTAFGRERIVKST